MKYLSLIGVLILSLSTMAFKSVDSTGKTIRYDDKAGLNDRPERGGKGERDTPSGLNLDDVRYVPDTVGKPIARLQQILKTDKTSFKCKGSVSQTFKVLPKAWAANINNGTGKISVTRDDVYKGMHFVGHSPVYGFTMNESSCRLNKWREGEYRHQSCTTYKLPFYPFTTYKRCGSSVNYTSHYFTNQYQDFYTKDEISSERKPFLDVTISNPIEIKLDLSGFQILIDGKKLVDERGEELNFYNGITYKGNAYDGFSYPSYNGATVHSVYYKFPYVRIAKNLRENPCNLCDRRDVFSPNFDWGKIAQDSQCFNKKTATVLNSLDVSSVVDGVVDFRKLDFVKSGGNYTKHVIGLVNFAYVKNSRTGEYTRAIEPVFGKDVYERSYVKGATTSDYFKPESYTWEGKVCIDPDNIKDPLPSFGNDSCPEGYIRVQANVEKAVSSGETIDFGSVYEKDFNISSKATEKVKPVVFNCSFEVD